MAHGHPELTDRLGKPVINMDKNQGPDTPRAGCIESARYVPFSPNPERKIGPKTHRTWFKSTKFARQEVRSRTYARERRTNGRIPPFT